MITNIFKKKEPIETFKVTNEFREIQNFKLNSRGIRQKNGFTKQQLHIGSNGTQRWATVKN